MKHSGDNWLRLAQKLRNKVNAGHWLEIAAVPVVVAAGISAAGLLFIRYERPDWLNAWCFTAAAILPLAALIWAFWQARKRFLSVEQALVRLEVKHGLNAALSSAKSGVGTWPAAPQSAEDGLRWNWLRTGVPPLLAVILVAAACWLPVTARTNPPRVSEPASWSVVESDLKTLVEQRIVDESSTEQARETIQALRERPQGNWFDHSSIEASDRALLSNRQEMAALEGRLREAARSLRQAAEAQTGVPANSPASEAMIEALRTGGLRPDSDLLQKLSEIAGENGSGLNQTDPRKLAEMLDLLEENARRLSEMHQMNPEMLDGEKNGEPGDAEGGQGPPERGPGDGGPLFGEAKEPRQTQRDEQLPTGDLSRTAPGDVLGAREARHELDQSDSPALRSGGAAASPGDGGGAVWSDTLHPTEQEALKRFFE